MNLYFIFYCLILMNHELVEYSSSNVMHKILKLYLKLTLFDLN